MESVPDFILKRVREARAMCRDFPVVVECKLNEKIKKVYRSSANRSSADSFTLHTPQINYNIADGDSVLRSDCCILHL